MADIFLSYSRSDAHAAKWVAEALGARGWNVWWDPGIAPGEEFRDRILEELQAARCAVVLWSSAAVKSGFVLDEAERARHRGVLVQALIERISPPLGFGHLQYATLIGWRGGSTEDFDQLCRGIARLAPLANSTSLAESFEKLMAQRPLPPKHAAEPPLFGFHDAKRGNDPVVPGFRPVSSQGQWASLQGEFVRLNVGKLIVARTNSDYDIWEFHGPDDGRLDFYLLASRAGELLKTTRNWRREIPRSPLLHNSEMGRDFQNWLWFLQSKDSSLVVLDDLTQRSARACAECAAAEQGFEA